MADSKAVDILREELEKSDDGSWKVNHLAIRVKWGQGDLSMGMPIGVFLEKHPEVFSYDGQVVRLTNPKGGKGFGGPPGLAAPVSKGGGAPPPMKRGWGDGGEPDSKAHRTDYGGAPTSKASAVAAFAKGDGGKNGKGSGGGGEEDSYLDNYLNAPPKGGFGKGGKPGKGGFDGKGGDGGKGGKDWGNNDKGGKGKQEVPWNSAKGGNQDELTPEQRKAAIREDALQPHQAQTGIETFKSNGVEIELDLLSKKLTPSDEARRNATRCLALVRSAVSSRWGQPGPNAPSVELCGSYAQGTEVHGAAMDIAFRVPPSFSLDDKSSSVSELRSRLSQRANDLETCDTLEHYPHTTSPMAIDLKGANPPLVAHILLEEQRVDRPPTLDEAIKQLCDTYKASYDIVRFVKVWSLNHGLTNHQEGFINGVAWTLIVIFFFQKQKLIPPYSQLSKGASFWPEQSDLSMSYILQNFFDFLVQHGKQMRGVSVWQGEDFTGPPGLFIEDPAYFLDQRQSRSLSESVGEQQWNRIVDLAGEAFKKIKVRPGRWFHWGEVFDPTKREFTKIQGLAQNLAGADMGDAGKGCHDGKGGKDDGKGAPWGGKDSDGKGGKSDGKGWQEGKGWSGKDGDGKGWSGKDSGKDDGKGWSGKDSEGKGWGKDDGKGCGKDSEGKGWGKDDSKGKGGKDDGKGCGKDSGKDWGKSGKDDGKGWSGKDGGKGWGKDDGKGYGKSWKDKGKPY